MLNRRKFLTQSALTTGAFLVGSKLTHAASYFEAPHKLTILHTNDTHSRIDPFPMDGSRNQGLGGVAARAQLIKQIRKQEEHVLLLDAGDIFQGTPYFNIYKGEPEIKAMTSMGYDATTIGNHDFDAGLGNLALQLERHASFPLIISNYDFANTPMEGRSQPYKIFKKGGLRIGILGVGIAMDGLVPANLFGNTKYLDPIQQANRYSAELKQKGCDLIICLSHLGYEYKEDQNKMCDKVLAKESENIDLIIGGHTHTFLDAPVVIKNKKGDDVLINQVGFAGIQLGRLDFIFEKSSKKKMISAQSILVTQKTEI
ncbi:bifunctional metallophosphatase/5'-nucleotidase [Flavisolibacter tropicus]|uniref:5'-nucleotidase n=1 Tax=Flavisolibacter tropicus TaxID=1492898 RepID=A0A172TU13_9BACT|nr:metallophosphoesterase [Flavisolibacter tropicus]ANE50458.1 5'-nucleotidase [Flavisolibacter tropicus]